MWRVVLDNTALTSALLNPHGPSARLLDFALQGRLRLFVTPRMLATQGRLLRRAALKARHGMADRELSRFLADLPVLFCLVSNRRTPQGRASMRADLLHCAALSHADYLVTSEPVDAVTAEQGGTQVVTADQLVKLVGRDS